jgi:3-oxoacyl-(acyl-carrier-protein) synthase
MNGRIVITGEGIVCAIGIDKSSVTDSLRLQRTGIGEMKYLSSVHKELPVGEVKLSNDEMKTRLNIPKDKVVSRTTLLGIEAVKQALDQAHITKQDSLRIVLISGTTVAGMDITEETFGNLLAGKSPSTCLEHHQCGACTAEIASYFDVFSDYTTISTACSSAANALILGAEMLKAGDADIVVAGGTEALSKFHLNGFNSLMILDHERCRPFDATRAGLNLGEGAAYVVLEREEEALLRGAKVDAWLAGYGNACDAFHQTASSPEDTGAQLSMRKALLMADLQSDDIQWVHAHGTGTQNNDVSEAVAISHVFDKSKPLVSSTKGFTGHTTSAAGAISAVISILAMQQDFVPANLGFNAPMENGFEPTMGIDDINLEHVMVNAFGFGGNDSSLILSKVPCGETNVKAIDDKDIVELAEISNDNIESLKEVKQYVKPMEARRMGKLMKSTLLTSLQALAKAGIAQPDAIVTGTEWGSLEYSEDLLKQLTEGEDGFKPTFFMQSTHNTLSSLIAIHLHDHGFNTTFSQGEKSMAWAEYQGRLLLRLGRCKNVLIGCHDESTPLFNEFLERMGKKERPLICSRVKVLAAINGGTTQN